MREEIIKQEFKIGEDDIEVVVYVEDGIYSAEVIKK